MAPHSSTLAWKIPWMEQPGRLQSMGSLSWTWLSGFTFTFCFHALEEEMATPSSVLAWRIPGTGEPGGLPSLGSHRVGQDWSNLAAAAAAVSFLRTYVLLKWRTRLSIKRRPCLRLLFPTSLVCLWNCQKNKYWNYTPAVKLTNMKPLIGKDSDAGRDWGQEEKGTTEDEMAGWHHWLDGCESEWTPGVGGGQGGLACCDSWGRKESDMTERLNWTELNWNTTN